MKQPFLGGLLLISLVITALPQMPPNTPVRPVSDVYFGKEIVDAYRWLEDLKDPEVISWLKAQNEYTHSVIDKFPWRGRIIERIRELDRQSPPPVKSLSVDNRGSYYFIGSDADGISRGYMRDRHTGAEHIADLFRAALISVGTTDMLRAEYQMNGPANVVEFGTVKDKTSFSQLYEMSAYYHVLSGKHYPAVLLTTGMRDPNVDVWQPAKMTAILQSVADTDRPVLLRIDPEAGHDQYGSTRAQLQAWRADQSAFLMWQLGVGQR